MFLYKGSVEPKIKSTVVVHSRNVSLYRKVLKLIILNINHFCNEQLSLPSLFVYFYACQNICQQGTFIQWKDKFQKILYSIMSGQRHYQLSAPKSSTTRDLSFYDSTSQHQISIHYETNYIAKFIARSISVGQLVNF